MCGGAAAVVLGLLAACATDGAREADLEDDPATPVPSPDADAGVDAESNEDAGACTDDCEYFLDDCTEDALCANGLFAPVATTDSLEIRAHVQAISARSATDAWLVGTAGAAAHFDGSTWRRSVTETQYSLNAIWLLSDGEVAVQTPSALFTRGLDVDAGAPSAGGWSLTGAASSEWNDVWPVQVHSSWAHPASDSLWVGTRHDRGGLWRLRRRPDGEFSFVSASLNKCQFVPCLEVSGMDGRSPNELWAVGPQGAAFRVTDAESDSPVLTGFLTDTSLALLDVWVAGESDVWAVGATGTVRRWRGDPRTFEIYDEVPTKKHLRAIAGSSLNDIWIAGDDAAVYHYDGAAWTRVKVAGLGARRPSLQHIWIPSPGKVWIAGEGALLSLGGKS